MSTTTEKVYYQGGNVLITSTRAEMAGKTCVRTNIISVSLVEVPPNRGCATYLLGLAVFVLIIGLVANSAAAILIGAVGAGLGFLMARSLKTEYAVNLSSASGETRAVQATAREQIGQMVSAIKQAIIDSGVHKVEAGTTGQIMPSSDDHVQKLKSLKDLLDAGVFSPPRI